MVEIDGKKYYSIYDLDSFDLQAQIQLIRYFFSTLIEKRQNNFLIYNPKALEFWIVPIKEDPKDNYKMFENGMSLRKYLDEKKFLDNF